ncbi:hypothetical protein [Anabaena sp. CCY 0017]
MNNMNAEQSDSEDNEMLPEYDNNLKIAYFNVEQMAHLLCGRQLW